MLLNGQVTMKEMAEQAQTWRTVWEARDSYQAVWRRLLSAGQIEELVFTGCGSSYYLASSAAAAFSKWTTYSAKSVPASEWLLYPDQHASGKRTLLVIISRSGTTTECLLVAEAAEKMQGVRTLAVTCHPDSALTQRCDDTLAIPAGREESVVMTKSFTSMLYLLLISGALLGENRYAQAELAGLPDRIAAWTQLEAEGKALSGQDYRTVVCLGAGPLYGIAQEAGLKVKEMAVQPSEVYHPLEYRHGPKSIVNDQTLIVLFASDRGREYEPQLMRELKQLGGRVWVIGGSADLFSNVDRHTPLEKSAGDWTRGLLGLLPLQQFGVHYAIRRGYDPDRPRHLSQVVQL
ncbi:SIS domain-containing protein [Polycladomyces subterraneus]|uniref:SIS domain-containing protein n=1 Tax=Polycladomyces subterraneus TaxID=1016997 RepID=A0ABT8IKV7_9BACL|nr:SIS domain-containing protein [Polycladomyces subterraneus]MDN4593420.1 SIS domain-containing protein [Polycladomyces subterraneus]